MHRMISIDGVNHNPGPTGTETKGVCKDWIFPGGEHGIQFYTGEQLVDNMQDTLDPVWLFMRNGDGRTIMETLNCCDALKRAGYEDVRLYMPYVPYGRQDRVTTPGTPFSLKMFADVINTADFNEVVVVDPHSPVTLDLFKNLRVIPASKVMEFYPRNHLQGLVKDLVIVAPDKGAVQRAVECALALGISTERVVFATKEREASSGHLKTTGVNGYKFQPNDELLFIDDICDGGATFLELAKYLKDNGLKRRPSLYVTHGIFSKGMEELDRAFHSIVSTDSFYRPDYVLPDGKRPTGLVWASLIPTELLLL